jgi:DNA-binding CsgD family transcriptional regulator
MLFGRDVECARVDALLDAARERRSGSLVTRGEAGIGKSALLEYAVARAEGFRVLRALGVESEAELAFAGVQQLVHPLIDTVDELPPPQARALKTALALEEGPAPERLAVSVATLSLLATAAEEQPLLCIVDDAHWLDRASAEALTFVARRLHADSVVMLFAAREPERVVFVSAGLPELVLSGLVTSDARALLGGSAPDLVDHVAGRLVELTHGNPLALLEISRAMSSESRAGREPLAEPLPVGAEIERVFLARAQALSPTARRVLLLVAAGDPRDMDTIRRALVVEGVDGAVHEAGAAGLLQPGRLDFCHPLARSAVYQGVPPTERRSAHRALAAVTVEAERRAWHLASAADGPDEAAAEALEEAADDARRRGGSAAEARALEESARLTVDRETRARRLFKAASAAEAAGWLARAETQLAEVATLTADSELRSRSVARRSYLLADRGEFDEAYALAVGEADRANPRQAAHMLSLGALFALTHSLDIPAALTVAERAWGLAGSGADADPHVRENFARTLILAGRSKEALALVRSSIDEPDAPSEVVVNFGTDLLYLEDYQPAREMLERILGQVRDAEATGFLSYALDQLAKLETRVANLTRAYALELECLQMVESLGNEVPLAASLAWLGLVEAMLGRPESRAHAEAALAIAESRSDAYNVARARGALGLEALARGDAEQAVAWLEPAALHAAQGGVGNPNFFRLDADLVEALARLGQPARAEPHLARLEQQTRSTGSVWGLAASARCRAFLAPDPLAPELFEHALLLHAPEPSAFELARTELCYGERLRRAGRRRDGREQLRSALETFDRIGAQPWAERCRSELRASGEHLRRRDQTAAERLTPQELQVALLVSDGLTNRDVAARLFLSQKTVEFHLTHIYRKLDIHSRSELVRQMVHVIVSAPPSG